MPAYNTNKTFHPKGDGKVGFILTPVGGVTYYHAGDTDAVPEMTGLAPDVALLPVSGPSMSSTANQAAEGRPPDSAPVAVRWHHAR